LNLNTAPVYGIPNKDVEIVLTPNPRSKKLCIFTINLGNWQSTVKFPSNREWVHNLFLQLIYRFGRVKSISYHEKLRLYPPNIHFYYPREKVNVLNALRFVKARDKEKLLKLFKSDIAKFEEEAVVLGIAGSLKR